MKLERLFVCLCSAALLFSGCSREAKTSSHLKRANVQLKAGDYDRAEIEYLNVLRLDSTNFTALRGLGMMAYDQGRLPRAYALLSAAQKAAPDDFDIRLKLALIFLAGGKQKEARSEAVSLVEKQ